MSWRHWCIHSESADRVQIVSDDATWVHSFQKGARSNTCIGFCDPAASRYRYHCVEANLTAGIRAQLAPLSSVSSSAGPEPVEFPIAAFRAGID